MEAMSPAEEPTIQTLHKTLTTQATTLLSELSAFRTYLTNHATTIPVPPNVLLGKFQVDVQRERNHLLKYSTESTDKSVSTTTTHDDSRIPEDLDGIHRIRSSNITFLGDVWEEVKRRKGVTGIRKGIKYVPLGSTDLSAKNDAEVAKGKDGVAGRGDVDGGVKEVSKKMNREARERVKMERKLQCLSQREGQHQDQNQDQKPSNGDDGNDIENSTPETESDPAAKNPKRTQTTQINTAARPRHRERESVTVDIIADHGKTWIKMFTKNQRWLMLDLAKEGIVDINDDSSGSDDGVHPESTEVHQRQRQRHSEAMEELKLVKMGREFLAASRSVRVGRGHRHPKVVFCLSKITRGGSRDVDLVLEYLGGIGVEVITADEVHGPGNGDILRGNVDRSEKTEEDVRKYELGLLETFRNMASLQPPIPITETLNVDCTVLIALISDISHSRPSDVTIPEHYKDSARRDIEVQLRTDVDDPLLPNHIYPILRGRRLVCTRKATEHWRNIVRIMGSPTEAARCKMFLGEGDEQSSPILSTRDNLQKLSVHDAPTDLRLPLEIVDFDLDDLNVKRDGSECNQVEIDVIRKLSTEPRLSSLNSSVFFNGWYRGLTTVSLNRVVSEWLERATNVVLNDLELRQGMTSDIAEIMGFCGTNALVCGRERSLLGSEK